MVDINRRTILRTAAAGVAGLAVTGATGVAAEAAPATAAGRGGTGPGSSTACLPALGPVTVGPDDVQYQDLIHRGNNIRYVARPDYVQVVWSTEQVRDAVQAAVSAGKRVTVRGGGHCLENFVDDPAVKVIIDLSGMTGVSFDPSASAFVVEAGALLSETYRRLFLGWGVTLPAGWCPSVGVGGHIPVGGYGVLSRIHGLSVDYLQAIEIVVVDQAGKARVVTASRDPKDPNHDLWWAHTGGGGGAFGIVTRYYFADPHARGRQPGQLLPTAPSMTLDFSGTWSWDGMDETTFTRLMANHTDWCRRNSAPGGAGNFLYAELIFHRRSEGVHTLVGQAFGPDADQLLEDYLAALSEGVGGPASMVRTWGPYLETALNGPDQTKEFRFKIKSAYLRSGFTPAQVSTIYQELTGDSPAQLLLGTVGLATYGGQINAVAADATATATRDAIIKLTYIAAWTDATADEQNDAWLRQLYRAIYRRTGGVPDPKDGAYIGYPDRDLADPKLNTSGVPWSALYFKGNYPRLQQVKKRWDPRNVFRHALAVEAPGRR